MAVYLVTGAAGFIASEVARQLLNEGHTVVGVDNLNDAYDGRLKTWRLAQLMPLAGFTFQQADIGDLPALTAIWDASPRFDAVFNLAARAGVRQSVVNPFVYVQTNVTGTLNLLELCRQRGVSKFILASTSSLYGSRNPIPYREDMDTDHPLSPYSASKKGAEALCHAYYHLHGIDVTVFRYFTVYGPAGRPDMSLFRFIQWVNEGRRVTIYGDGMQSRDFTFVQDIARGTILGLRPLGYEIINLGSDRPARLIDALRLVETKLGRAAEIEYLPFQAADIMATWADISRAEELIGWRPAVTLEQGIEATIAWYLANRDWAKDIITTD